jgi:ferredoxin
VTTADARVLDLAGLQALLDALREQGRTVIGPRVRDAAIALGEVTEVADLPVGYRDEQSPGHYRARPEREGQSLFAFAAPAQSWRRFLQPSRELLWSGTRTASGFQITQTKPPTRKVAFFGIRSCDLAALGITDRVLGGGRDGGYTNRRSDVFTVTASCTHPSDVCFCTSMGTGPAADSGYDLRLVEVCDAQRHEFLVDAGSAAGAEMLARLPHSAARPELVKTANDAIQYAADSMVRSMDPAAPRRAAQYPDHPHWDDVASRCLACSNCTLVCPTCFCGGIEDRTDLTGETAERWRNWDSCFNEGFSFLHGGPVRADTKSRYRQWLMHKLVTWEDQFGTSGCVGCGRCITWCPPGIDLTAEIAALAEAPGGAS